MILIFTEAGEGIGFGHFTRMMALSDALVNIGATVAMLVQWEGSPVLELVENRPWVYSHPWRTQPVSTASQFQASCVVIDSYRLPLEGYQTLAAKLRLVAVDDFYRLPYPANLVINPNVFADPQRYLPSASAAMGGESSVLIRQAFAKNARSFKVRASLQNVLLTLGGSDVHNLGPVLANSLSDHGYQVTWIAPEGVPPSFNSATITVVGSQNARGFIELIHNADLVVSGGGQTLHELSCLGAPFVALELGDDQRLNLGFYEKAGLLGPRLLWNQPNLHEAILARIASLSSHDQRVLLSQKSATLIDGSGPKRIANIINRLSKG